MDFTKAYLSRQEMIDLMETWGFNYNFGRWPSWGQIKSIFNKCAKKAEERANCKITAESEGFKKPLCAKCGITLTDGGFCPTCDDGEPFPYD